MKSFLLDFAKVIRIWWMVEVMEDLQLEFFTKSYWGTRTIQES
jgi:hypothetical protein